MNMRGFTLIELVVTLGIMVLITSVTLANHSKFGGKVLLRTTAYELALAFREAQTYGISVRKININDGEFQSAYGLHFNASNPTQYIMFADISKDGLYTPGEDTLVSNYNIGKGYKLNKLCVGIDTDSTKCVNVRQGNSGSLDVTFKRPEPDASIRFDGISNQVYANTKIELISPRGDLINVFVEVSGQISVMK